MKIIKIMGNVPKMAWIIPKEEIEKLEKFRKTRNLKDALIKSSLGFNQNLKKAVLRAFLG